MNRVHSILLAWLVPSWIVFEIVITKLPHYVLPLYPAIAILIIGALERKVLSRTAWIVRGSAWWFVLPLIMTVASIVGAMVSLAAARVSRLAVCRRRIDLGSVRLVAV